MSNGLPPPDPDRCESDSCPLAFEVEVAASSLLVLVAASFLVLVVWVVSALCLAAVAACAVVERLSVLFEDVVSELSDRVDFVVLADCAAGVLLTAFEVVLAVVATTTPGLVVGIVTESTAEEADSATAVVVFAAVVGHSACTIPPFITIANSVFELTDTSSQASAT